MAAIDPRASFLSAADTFESLVSAVPDTALDGPGLGAWDLRALVGHASRSLVTVETYLDQPADAVQVPTAADYYVAIAGALIDHAAVTERGRAAGEALGEDPAAFVAALAQRVRNKLDDRPSTYVVTTIAGAMELDEYLRTRTFELVVHGLDIAAPDLLLALTGRRALPDGFSVV